MHTIKGNCKKKERGLHVERNVLIISLYGSCNPLHSNIAEGGCTFNVIPEVVLLDAASKDYTSFSFLELLA